MRNISKAEIFVYTVLVVACILLGIITNLENIGNGMPIEWLLIAAILFITSCRVLEGMDLRRGSENRLVFAAKQGE